MQTPLILASSSPYRAELLARLGLPFIQDRPDIDETALPGETPSATTLRLAMEKARHVARRHPGHLVIGSDQLASLHGRAIGKPLTRERAASQLRELSGQHLVFHTALCVWDARDDSHQLADTPCEVTYRELDEDTITRYLARELALDCAGATKIEGLGITLTTSVRCDDPTALIGLPLIRLIDFLHARGILLP